MLIRASPPRLFRSETVSESLRVYLPATLLSKALGLARGMVLPWLMVPSEYGRLGVALMVVNLLLPVCSAGLNDAVQRYVPYHESRGSLRRFLRTAVPLVLAAGSVAALILLLAAAPVGSFLFQALEADSPATTGDKAAALTRVAVLTALALVVFFLIVSTLKGLRMYRAIGLIELSTNAGFAVLAVLVCLLGWNSAVAVIGSYAVTLAAGSLVAFLPLPGVIRWIERHPARVVGPSGSAGSGPADGLNGPEPFGPTLATPAGIAARLFRFSRWAALAAVTWQVLLGYPLWHLHRVAGPEAAAVFAAALLLAQGMLIVANSIVTVVETAVTRTWESAGPAEADRHLLPAYKAATLVLLTGGCVVAVAAPWIMRVLPSAYAAGAAILPRLILFYLLAGHLLFLGIHFHLIERTRHLFVPWLLGVAGHVACSAWLVKPGAAATTAAAWSGIVGMSVALAAALALMVIERRPLDRGAYLLVPAGFALAAPRAWVPLVVIGLLWTAVVASDWILTAPQKARLRQGLHEAAGLLKALLGRGRYNPDARAS
jgi:O-antigen/teichoic acid export membrane protein